MRQRAVVESHVERMNAAVDGDWSALEGYTADDASCASGTAPHPPSVSGGGGGSGRPERSWSVAVDTGTSGGSDTDTDTEFGGAGARSGHRNLPVIDEEHDALLGDGDGDDSAGHMALADTLVATDSATHRLNESDLLHSRIIVLTGSQIAAVDRLAEISNELTGDIEQVREDVLADVGGAERYAVVVGGLAERCVRRFNVPLTTCVVGLCFGFADDTDCFFFFFFLFL
jgi:hypothetical protein